MEEIRYKELLEEKESVIASLIESNDCLQEEVSRLRNSNRILRTVHKALRGQVSSLLRQIELARFNDETFKAFCNGEFDSRLASTENGGLPESGNLVESAAIDAEKAPAQSTSC